MTGFILIPVLDLQHGAVVRARAGDRASYQPIVTPLSATSDPADVLQGLLGLWPFRHLYVADLDAIGGEGSHRGAVAALAKTWPAIEIWLDGGFTAAIGARAVLAPGIVPVFGTESLAGAGALAAATGEFGRAGIVLSLDYRGGDFLGAPEIELRPELWPDRVILMTLDRVGMSAGPDLVGLADLVRRAEGRAVFAAGGVRNEGDVAALRGIGVRGALVASALHDGRLSRDVLGGLLA